MTIEDILGLKPVKAIEILCKDTKSGRNPAEYLKEYKGERKRRKTSVGFREDKEITIYSDTLKDENGNPKKVGSKTVSSAKFHTNYPKRIVSTSVAFLFGGDMSISFSKNNDASDYFKEVFAEKLKMQSLLGEFAETVEIETKSALVFYPRPTVVDGKEALQVRAKLLKSKNGEFYPHFDEYGDLDAFVRRYKGIHEDGKEHNFVWIQTAVIEMLLVDIDGTWTVIKKEANLAGKITVVYAEQDEPEWEGVTTALDAFEMRVSRLTDTNDYFSEPILKTFGDTSLPSKSTAGKEINFPVKIDEETGKEYHGDAEYLAWMQSIDSISKELEVDENEIMGGSFTPNFFMEKLTGIGNVSEITMKLMFMDAYIKVGEKMRIFGPAIQRSVSVVKTMLATITDTSLANGLAEANPKVSFGSILPDNLSELIDTLRKANGDKPVNAQATITALSPFTKDADEEVKQIQQEAQAESNQNSLTGMSL